MNKEDKRYELSAEEARNVIRSYVKPDEEQPGIVGAIFDQDEALAFLQWLCSDEVQEIRKQLRAQRTSTEDESHQ
jgi:ABC-type Fe3+ transport system substrate-binding protein